MGTRGSNCCHAHPHAVIRVLHRQGQGQTCPSKMGNVEGVPVVFWGVKGSARLERCWAGFGDGELTIITINIAIAITITIFSVNIFSFKQHLWSFASWGSKKLCLPAAWHWEQSLTPLPKKNLLLTKKSGQRNQVWDQQGLPSHSAASGSPHPSHAVFFIRGDYGLILGDKSNIEMHIGTSWWSKWNKCSLIKGVSKCSVIRAVIPDLFKHFWPWAAKLQMKWNA